VRTDQLTHDILTIMFIYFPHIIIFKILTDRGSFAHHLLEPQFRFVLTPGLEGS